LGGGWVFAPNFIGRFYRAILLGDFLLGDFAVLRFVTVSSFGLSADREYDK